MAVVSRLDDDVADIVLLLPLSVFSWPLSVDVPKKSVKLKELLGAEPFELRKYFNEDEFVIVKGDDWSMSMYPIITLILTKILSPIKTFAGFK